MRRINLIPPEHATGKKAFVETGLNRKAFWLGMIAFIAFSVHYGVAFKEMTILREEVHGLDTEFADAEAHSEEIKQAQATLGAQVENVEKRLSLLAQKRNELVGLKADAFKWSEVLDQFKTSIPSNIWMDRMKLSFEESFVQGGTYSNEKVSEFINRLNRKPYFKNVTFKRTAAGALNDRPIVEFELGLDMVRVQKKGK